MSSLDLLHYIVSAAIIVIALVVIFVGVGIILLIAEAKMALRAVRKTATDITRLKESMQSGMIGNVISFGKNIFQKKPHND